jgi:hypothetical protein
MNASRNYGALGLIDIQALNFMAAASPGYQMPEHRLCMSGSGPTATSRGDPLMAASEGGAAVVCVDKQGRV